MTGSLSTLSASQAALIPPCGNPISRPNVKGVYQKVNQEIGYVEEHEAIRLEISQTRVNRDLRLLNQENYRTFQRRPYIESCEQRFADALKFYIRLKTGESELPISSFPTPETKRDVIESIQRGR